MKIRKLLVRNFRSLREVFLDDVGSLAVLIGANNSGKSNLLEAIFVFLREFDPGMKRGAGPMDENMWFNKTWSSPVEFEFGFELSKLELKDLLPFEILKRIEVEEKNSLEIKRVIIGKPKSATWQTQDVKVNDAFLIENGRFVFESDGSKTDFSGAILEKISQRLSGGFRLVSAARDLQSVPTGLSVRLSFLQSEVLGDLESLGRAGQGSAERQWIEEKVKKACRDMSDLRVMDGRRPSGERGSETRIAAETTGSGNQEIIGMACQLLRVEKIAYGIEEPEIHLHSESLKRLLSVLKALSSEKQVFVTTHSAALVDQADLHDVWIVRKERGESHIFRIKAPEMLKNALYELGLRPSDISYANGLIFVETHTERVVFQIWAAKLGIDLEKLGIVVIPTYGKLSHGYRFALWTDAAEQLGIPYYFILEKGAQGQTKDLSKKLVPNENLFLLDKGSIEEYYPNERVDGAVEKEFGVVMPKGEAGLKRPKEKSIEQFLMSKGKDSTGWRVAIGTIVAESMSTKEIDDKIRKILETIRTKQEQIFK